MMSINTVQGNSVDTLFNLKRCLNDTVDSLSNTKFNYRKKLF